MYMFSVQQANMIVVRGTWMCLYTFSGTALRISDVNVFGDNAQTSLFINPYEPMSMFVVQNDCKIMTTTTAMTTKGK